MVVVNDGGEEEGGVYFRVLARILCLRPGLVIYNSHTACTVGSERKNISLCIYFAIYSGSS